MSPLVILVGALMTLSVVSFNVRLVWLAVASLELVVTCVLECYYLLLRAAAGSLVLIRWRV